MALYNLSENTNPSAIEIMRTVEIIAYFLKMTAKKKNTSISLNLNLLAGKNIR
jgi:hypothetical protein